MHSADNLSGNQALSIAMLFNGLGSGVSSLCNNSEDSDMKVVGEKVAMCADWMSLGALIAGAGVTIASAINEKRKSEMK